MSREEVLAILDKRWDSSELYAEIEDPDYYTGVPVISTGVNSLDYVSGGGIPRGMITEWWGPEGGGKTTTSLLAAVEAHKEGDGEVAFIDMEAKLRNWRFLHNLGIQRDKFHIIRPSSGDEAADIITELIKSSLFELIILDSIAMLYPERIQDSSAGDQQYASIARLASRWLGATVVPLLGNTKTAFLMLNQERMNITNYGAFPHAVGGKAIAHHCVVINRLKKTGSELEDDNGDPVGIEVQAVNKKNQMDQPFRSTEYQFFFRSFGNQDFGVNRELDTLMVAQQAGVVTTSGSWYYYIEDGKRVQLGHGKNGAAARLKKEPELYEKIHDMIMDT